MVSRRVSRKVSRRVSRKVSRKVLRRVSRKVSRMFSRKVSRKVSRMVSRRVSRKVSRRVSRKVSTNRSTFNLFQMKTKTAEEILEENIPHCKGDLKNYDYIISIKEATNAMHQFATQAVEQRDEQIREWINSKKNIFLSEELEQFLKTKQP
jgi:2-methylcitrate dehydratase PrpD